MSIYFPLAMILVVLGLHGLFVCAHPLRKVLALNVLSTGGFLLLVTTAAQSTPPDPVPHAMVLTGIVVTVSTTAVALTLVARRHPRNSNSTGGRSVS